MSFVRWVAVMDLLIYSAGACAEPWLVRLKTINKKCKIKFPDINKDLEIPLGV